MPLKLITDDSAPVHPPCRTHVTQGWGPQLQRQEHRSPESQGVSAGRGLSSLSIRFYTWGNWRSEGPKDSFKVAELVNGRAGSRKCTSWSPGSQLLLPLQSHLLWASIAAGPGASLMAKVSSKEAPMNIVFSPAPQVSNKIWLLERVEVGFGKN